MQKIKRWKVEGVNIKKSYGIISGRIEWETNHWLKTGVTNDINVFASFVSLYPYPNITEGWQYLKLWVCSNFSIVMWHDFAPERAACFLSKSINLIYKPSLKSSSRFGAAKNSVQGKYVSSSCSILHMQHMEEDRDMIGLRKSFLNEWISEWRENKCPEFKWYSWKHNSCQFQH